MLVDALYKANSIACKYNLMDMVACSLMYQVVVCCRNPMDMALPAETNSYDSGVFALLFAEYASRDGVIDFTSENIGASRIKMISDIILKRIHIPRTS